MVQLDDTFTLTLEGLGLYLAPVGMETVVDYRFYPLEDWLELGLEWNLNRADNQQLNPEVFVLGSLAAGEAIYLRVGEREWTVPPFPEELLEDGNAE